ncbi:hypothetical protein SAMN06265337_2309 [Hymenobacter gelipurpurascens]|uniref:DUF2490 domain-containing protein n=1 Tax=Hymenobacter gelipurpurascens TaxID=89968 RepID=A0A212TQY6_9BACT|nr:hypothetical protein [Hymenobacter gelipurpurascens]SNC68427.1 hypothetical protein SAMN06265337_2309 [Hymenobacter gelipurpurascens]
MTTYFFPRASLLGLFLLLLFASQSALGQVAAPDSSRISYEEEESDQSDFNLKERYNYLIRSQIEESQLWKLGLNDVGYDFGRFRYGVYLIYERKLGTLFSVLGELNPTAQPGWQFVYNPSNQQFTRYTKRYFDMGAQVAGRYYYNLKKRIRQGKSANNFSANYFSAAIQTNISYIPYSDVEKYYANTATPSMCYGLQRRLGRYGFVDGNVGLQWTPIMRHASWHFDPELMAEFRIGLALGK